MLRRQINGFSVIRHFSSKNENFLKELNAVNKALFGAVTKTPKPTKKKTESTTDENETTPSHVSSSFSPLPQYNDKDLSSEIFWLMKHKPTMPIIKQMPTRNNQPSKDSSEIAHNSIPPGLTAFNESILPKPVELAAPKTTGRPILLSKSELKKLPNFPLIPNQSFREADPIETDHVPSVGKVLQATMPEGARKALMQWKLLKIAELGEEGFDQMQKQHLTTGSEFHLSLQNYLKTGQMQKHASPLKELWTSVTGTLIKLDPEPVFVEKSLIHPILQYKGIVDCLSSIDNELTVIEWKKADRLKANIGQTYDAPLQLCAYLGALNADTNSEFQIRRGIIVVAYTTGQPANLFELNEQSLKMYWRAWLLRLQEYWIRCRDGTLPDPI